MSRYQLEIDDQERIALILCVGIRLGTPGAMATDAQVVGYTNLFTKLLDLKPTLVPRAPEAPTSSAEIPRGVGEPLKLQNSPPDPAPPNSKEISVSLVKSVEKSTAGDRLIVKWAGGQASAWKEYKPAFKAHPNLWALVLATIKKPATFYVIETQKGENTYLNIVGVKNA